MAAPILGGLKFIKVSKKWSADTGNLTFSLLKYWRWLLLACATTSAARQHFGNPIHCNIAGGVALPVFESYCFMEGTFTLHMDHAAVANTSTLHHGMGHGLGREDDRNVHQNYYIWANLVMVLLAALSYLPWLAWKTVEGGKVTELLATVSQDPLTETPVEEQVGPLADFLLSHRSWFNGAALKLLLCQAGCLLAALAQLYLLDFLLGRRFLRLGGTALDPAALRHALATTFPTVVTCYMPLFGVSGSLTTVSGMCTLPLNIVHEKIFLVLWFWLMVLALVALVQLARQAALLSSTLRPYLSPTLSSEHQARQLVTCGSYGDTVLLELVAANCDQVQVDTLVGLLLRHHGRPSSLPTSHTPLLSHHRLEKDLLNQDSPDSVGKLKV